MLWSARTPFHVAPADDTTSLTGVFAARVVCVRLKTPPEHEPLVCRARDHSPSCAPTLYGSGSANNLWHWCTPLSRWLKFRRIFSLLRGFSAFRRGAARKCPDRLVGNLSALRNGTWHAQHTCWVPATMPEIPAVLSLEDVTPPALTLTTRLVLW